MDQCKLEASLVYRPNFREAKEKQTGGLSRNKTRTKCFGFFFFKEKETWSV